jgi:hypothetical protein
MPALIEKRRPTGTITVRRASFRQRGMYAASRKTMKK